MQKILLHVCCGPCAAHCVEVLRKEYEVTLFFSNSNIVPEQEYRRRLGAARELAGAARLPLVEDVYEHDMWLEHVRGCEAEPEGGRRCAKCFEYNLGRAAAYARETGFDAFTTTLTVSPHKDSATIFRTGMEQGRFLPVNFKKNDGFKRSSELSREYGLYRQSYCGCEFCRRGEDT
jgi:predicted adenine nucleotide alpha hydrolase (AANH) superfamily ATPase